MRTLLRLVLVLLPAVALLTGVKILGDLLQPDKVLGTCGASTEGAISRQLGGVSEGTTKLCVCRSDGAASPAYQWCSLTLSQAAAVVCTGGTTTTCP